MKSMLGGIMPYFKIKIAFSSPATPLEASRCPIFDLIEPT